VQVNDLTLFEQVVSAAFAQRRKTLRNTLKGLINADAMEANGIDPSRRGETLSLPEFAVLANLLAK
jgi:16S rRNA (adenine1518-N6/adenine1519-N6)-dimethyltransferase